MFQVGFHVLVAASRKGYYHNVGWLEGKPVQCSQGVCRLECGQYSVNAVKLIGCGKGLVVVDGQSLCAACFYKVGVERANARVIQSGRYGVWLYYLSVIVLYYE